MGNCVFSKIFYNDFYDFSVFRSNYWQRKNSKLVKFSRFQSTKFSTKLKTPNILKITNSTTLFTFLHSRLNFIWQNYETLIHPLIIKLIHWWQSFRQFFHPRKNLKILQSFWNFKSWMKNDIHWKTSYLSSMPPFFVVNKPRLIKNLCNSHSLENAVLCMN